METFIQGLQPEELKKLEFDQLKPDWIRHKGYIQMKMISEKEDGGGKLSSWKVYYAVLSNGFLLLYKEGHVKSSNSSSSKVKRRCVHILRGANTKRETILEKVACASG